MITRLLNMLRSPQGRDAVLTTLTEGMAMLGMVYAYHLAAKGGTSDLDLYVITRRTVSFAYPLILLGMAVGLTRFVAMRSDPEDQRSYLRAALVYIMPLGLLFFGASVLLKGPAAWVVFGSYEQEGLLIPLGLMIFGVSLHGTAYSYLRGRGSIVLANSIQFFDLAAAPCIAFILGSDLEQVLWITGSTWTVVSLLVLLPHALGRQKKDVKRERAQLLRYGLPRVPGDLAMGALLTVPVYVAARTHGLSVSGQVGFGATLLNIAAALFSPLALLLLPATSAQLARGDHAALAARVKRIALLSLLVSAAMVITFEIVAEPLLHAYLGDAYAQYVRLSRITFIGALPFGLFYGLRSVLDAYYHTPRNGVNLTISFFIILLGAAVHLLLPTPPETMGVVLVIALFYLGYATWRDTRFVLSELERMAAKEGQPLRVALVRSIEGNAHGSILPIGQDAGSSAHVLSFDQAERGSLGQLITARGRFKRFLLKERPDVVHVQGGATAALLTVLSSAVPVVVQFDRSAFGSGWSRQVISQLTAFFAAGILCDTAETKEGLWWRADEAQVLPEPASQRAAVILDLLRSTAVHAPSPDQ